MRNTLELSHKIDVAFVIVAANSQCHFMPCLVKVASRLLSFPLRVSLRLSPEDCGFLGEVCTERSLGLFQMPADLRAFMQPHMLEANIRFAAAKSGSP